MLLNWLPIDWVLAVLGLWLMIGIAGVALLRNFDVVARLLFPLGGMGCLVIAWAALQVFGSSANVAVLPLGLPNLPFHLRLDGLAAYFLFIIGAAGAGISVFAAGYFRRGTGTPPGLLCLEYHVFLASMVMVILADDAYAFMVAWETMALSSFFLVTASHKLPEVQRAGFLYLLIAHVGAISILLCFGVLQANSGDYTFASMRAQTLTPFWASVAFALAVIGFGAKAGMVPLHVWLPEAHPAAPSPVSALMSGVMLKTAIYGLLRVTLDILPQGPWWWGGTLLGLGLLTALYGAVFATVQTDMKRLLAYSSIENIGLLLAGMGLALIFHAYQMPLLTALALTATLYHVASHAFFKSLLFLSTGAVLHATGERNLGRLGGLIRFMPWTAWLALIGVFASSGLPPFSGFVSEWLLLQSFLFSPSLPDTFLNMFIPIVAAVIALVAALAGYTMVKFFGVIFLGQPREEKLKSAADAGLWEKIGLLWLAAWCIGLGLFPSFLIHRIDTITTQWVDAAIGRQEAMQSWLYLVPISANRASYAPVLFLLGVLAGCLLAFFVVRLLYHGRLRRVPPWDCGHRWQTARMQDTAEGFGQPIRQIFEPFFRMERHLPAASDDLPHYRVELGDHFWHWLYLPIARLTERAAAIVGRLQQGRIAIYLLYSFVTLLFMLFLVQQ